VLIKINNNNLTADTLFKGYEIQYIYSSLEDSEVVFVFERNDAGFRKLAGFFLNS
jgi:hypothetical protein